MWSVLVSWVTVAIVVPVVIGIGVGVLSMSPPHYTIAQVCFTVSAFILLSRVGWWIAVEQAPNTTPVQRSLFAFCIFGVVGVLWAQSVVWVGGLRPNPSPAETTKKPEGQSSRQFLQGLTYTPPAGEIKLQFKASPFFNHKTKRRIIRDVTRFRDYLTTLGIPVPLSVPPISVALGDNTGGTQTPPGLPTYRGTVQLGKKQIGIPSEATDAYCGYAIDRIFVDDDSPFQPWYGGTPTPNNVEILMRMLMLERGVATYFNSSFWNQRGEFLLGPWAYRLWRIRNKFGRDFTDRLVAFALKSMIDTPNEGRDDDLDVYFARKLKIGDSIVDDGMHKWPLILDILREEKIPVERV